MTLSIEIIALLIITGICSVIFACVTRAAAPVFFMLLVFASAISAPISDGVLGQLTWIGPIQLHRSELFLAASLLLLLNLVVLARGYQPAATPMNAKCMVGVGLLMGVLQAAQGDPIEGILTGTLTAVSLGATIAFLTQTRSYLSSYRHFAGSIFAANLLILGVIAVQMVLNPNAMLSSEWSRRFQGITGNPQFLGAQFAITTTIALWMLLNSSRRLLLTLCVGVIGLNCLFIVWTGSRTGLGMTVIGVSVVMFSRFRQAAIGVPIAAIGVAAAYKLIGNVLTDIDTSRLASFENTREGAWTHLLEVYAANPIIGAGFESGEVDKSENSLLYSMAGYGTSMGLLYVLTVLTTMTLCYKLYRLRSSVAVRTKGMIDLVFAVNGAFFAGTILEGYFIARVNVLLVFFVGINVVGYQLLRQAGSHATVASPGEAKVETESDFRDEDALDRRPNYAELTHA